MQKLIALLSGVLFGAGLLLSGLADPAKVLGFLDVGKIASGNWDPSLILVMASALGVYLSVYRILVRPRLVASQGPLLDTCYYLPQHSRIDVQLVLGAALFGLGWGLLGVCPGPAVVNLASLDPQALGFMALMLLGISMGRLIRRRMQPA